MCVISLVYFLLNFKAFPAESILLFATNISILMAACLTVEQKHLISRVPLPPTFYHSSVHGVKVCSISCVQLLFIYFVTYLKVNRVVFRKVIK